MNKFLKTYKLPKLSQEKIGDINGPIISKEFELVINLLQRKVQAQMA